MIRFSSMFKHIKSGGTPRGKWEKGGGRGGGGLTLRDPPNVVKCVASIGNKSGEGGGGRERVT